MRWRSLSSYYGQSLSGRSAKIKRVQRAVFCMSFQLFVQKTASLNFCTPDNLFVQKTASLNFCTPDNLFVQKNASLNFCTPDNLFVQKNASLNFCTPDNLFVESYNHESHESASVCHSYQFMSFVLLVRRRPITGAFHNLEFDENT